MDNNCPCGGRFLRSDIQRYYDVKYKRWMYRDTDPYAAHWQCNACGRKRTQRKRQPRRKEKTDAT